MSQPEKIRTAKAEMLIRKPISEVFDAFINPEITSQIWFTKSSGKLQKGLEIEWTWEMYNHSAIIKVLDIEANKRILIEWMAYGYPTTVEWVFKSLADDQTFVSITNGDFQGELEEIIKSVRDSTEGFTLVLAGLKALFEHNIKLNLVGDRFPQGL